MNTPTNSEALPPTTGSASSDPGYDTELTTAQLHAQWVAKYEQTHDLWNRDNYRNNDRIEALEKAINSHLDEFAWMDGPEGWRESVQALRDALSQNSD